MISKKVAIVTDWGSHIGFGHAQRMLSFLAFMNRSGRAEVSFVCNNPPEFFPDEFKSCFIETPASGCDIIIRDMRDSSVREIEALRGIAPVLVVDDNGEGRSFADYRIDLLPNPKLMNKNPDYHEDAFLFGYNFSESVRLLEDIAFVKNIDCAIYAGSSVDNKKYEYMKELLPPEASIAHLKGGGTAAVCKNGTETFTGFAHALCSSKLLLTYFGVTLYEGAVSGCRVVTVNPGEYHSGLCDIAPAEFGIFNAGVEGLIDSEKVRSRICDLLAEPPLNISADSVMKKIRKGLLAFSLFVEEIIDLER